jgi:hypothetical protein
MRELYHVCEDWDGGDLKSLYRQHGDDAYDMFAEKWPEAGGLGDYHIMYVHLYSSLKAAQDHSEAFGGEILVIKYNSDDPEFELERDSMEFDHPMVRDAIPKHLVKKLKAT